MKKIAIASKNKMKLDAVSMALEDFGMLGGVEIISRDVPSEVSDQPKSIEEIVRGARNRARNAFGDCDASVGLEAGLMAVPYTSTGYMDVVACAIFDGKEYHIGLSSAFEFPKEVIRLVFEEGIDPSQAANKMGLVNNEKINSEGGIVSIMSKGRLLRSQYTKEAVRMALIHLENSHLF